MRIGVILQTNLLLTSLKITPYKAHSVIILPLPEIILSSLPLSHQTVQTHTYHLKFYAENCKTLLTYLFRQAKEVPS